MDGYAVRAADVPGVLRIVGTVAAGRPETRGRSAPARRSRSRPAASCRRVPTRWSRSSESSCAPEEIEIAERRRLGRQHPAAGRGRARRRRRCSTAGNVLTPARLAALAACGIAERGRAPAPTRRDRGHGHRAAAAGRAARAGPDLRVERDHARGALCERRAPSSSGCAAAEDSEEALEQALDRALGRDVVVTSGGVSVGPHDLVRRVEARLGVEEVFWGVAMRPGKPLAFGVRGADARLRPARATRSPRSSAASCSSARRCSRSRAIPIPRPRFRPGILAREVRAAAGARRLRPRDASRGATAGPLLDPIVGQESHMIVRTTAADAIVHVPRGTEPLAAGRPGPASCRSEA